MVTELDMDYYPSGDGTHVLVTYRIMDTGIGIGKEFIGKIFDEFAQEEGGARTKYKGTTVTVKLPLEEQNMKVTRAVDGQDAVEQFRAAADAGMNAHLSKPVNPDVFYKALREHVHVQSSLCTASVPRH